jgi:PAS domain S-box-containing protein
MSDILLEIIRFLITGIIFICLWSAGKREGIRTQKGWSYILAGFSLILFGMLIDITDNFPALNKYVIIGDTEYEAFLEKVVGFLSGFLLLAIGFWKWMPIVVSLKETERKIKESYDELELNVKERTLELSKANEDLESEIAERRQAEELLRVSEERIRSLLETIPLGVYECDTNGKVTLTNESYSRITGYSRDEILSMHIWDFMEPGPQKDSLPENINQLIKEQPTPVPYIARNINKDGQLIDVQVEWDYKRDRQGKVIGFVCILSDITERRQAEEELIKSAFYLDTIPDALSVTTPDAKIVKINDAFTKLWGYSPEEAIGMSALDLFAEEELPKHEREIGIAIKEGVVRQFETVALTKDGKRIPVVLSGRALTDKDGNITTLIAVITDITERKLAEEQIEASLMEKEVLLREIHHRVKNNMQVISSLLRLQAVHIKDKQHADLFEESHSRIRSMALVHENLYQSKDLAEIKFGVYIRKVTNSLFSSYEIYRGRIAMEINAEDVSIGVDTAIPCGLIVNELVSNSLKHAFPGDRRGKIRIAFRSIDRNEFLLTVGDNGAGFPEGLDFRDTKTMGMRLVNLLTKQLHGEIELNRAEGTEFKIMFKEKKPKIRNVK